MTLSKPLSKEEWKKYFKEELELDDTEAELFGDKFSLAKIRREVLDYLDDADLKEIGVDTFGDRKLILLRKKKKTEMIIETESNSSKIIDPDDTSMQLRNLNMKFDTLNKKFAKIFIGEAANRVKKFILKISEDERLLEMFRNHCNLTPDAFERLKKELQGHVEMRDAICHLDYKDVCSFDTAELEDCFRVLNLSPSDFPCVLTK